MSTIAVIDREHQVVWGIGPTTAAAMADARSEIAGKAPEIKAQVGELEYAHLRDDADLGKGGPELWDWVVLDDNQQLQEDLF